MRAMPLQAANFLGCTRLKDEMIGWLREVAMEVLSESKVAAKEVGDTYECLYTCPRA